MTYSRIAGTGRYLPEKILTNADLEKIVDTTDEWIRTRTGVERRHVVAPEQTTSDMCVEAAKVAMDAAGIGPADIDMVIIGTTSPDLIFPNIATLVQHRLGIPACPCEGGAIGDAPFEYHADDGHLRAPVPWSGGRYSGPLRRPDEGRPRGLAGDGNG